MIIIMRARKAQQKGDVATTTTTTVPSFDSDEQDDETSLDTKSHKRESNRLILSRLALFASALVGIVVVQARIFLQVHGSGASIALSASKLALADMERAVLSLRRTKPKIYIDIGPYDDYLYPLQCLLSRKIVYDMLQRDNMLYLGTCNADCPYVENDNAFPVMEPSSFCIPIIGANRVTFTRSGNVSPLMKNELNRLARLNRNALLVWERLGGATPASVGKLLNVLRDTWEVHLIVHYRPLYEWLPSYFHHLQRPGWDGREPFMIWPRDGLWRPNQLMMAKGRQRVPLDVYDMRAMTQLPMSDRDYTMLSKIVNGSHHPVELALTPWSTNLSDPTVHMVEMDHLGSVSPSSGGDPFLTHLFCHVIPSLHNTCHAVRSNGLGTFDVGRVSPFPAENYDLLAVHAHLEGLHPRGIARLTRPEVWDLIQEHQEVTLGKNSSDFPVKCASPEVLDDLLELSTAVESSIRPGRENEHRRQFSQTVTTGQYCYVDAMGTLEHPDWKDFFLPYLSVAPHVVERIEHGRSWTPKLDRFKSTDELFFSYRLGRPHKAWLPQLDLVAFLNVPGTGASVILDHLLKTHRDLSFVSHISASPNPLPFGAEVPVACIFGSPQMLLEPSASTAAVTGTSLPRCPESVLYSDLVLQWLRYLPNLAAAGRVAGPYNESMASSPHRISSWCPRRTRLRHGNQSMTDETYDETSDLQASLTMAMVVRDPLDRLISLFVEWTEHKRPLVGHEALPHTLESWLELIGTEAEGVIPEQYASLEENVRSAMARIRGPKANTLVLLHECWDLSVHLLSVRHPTVFDAKVTKDVLASRASQMIRDSATSSHVDATHGAGLRRRARSWFANDYKFYEAAVDRFLQLVTLSGADEARVEECVSRLEQRGYNF